MEKRTERTLLSRSNTGSSVARSWCFIVALPTPPEPIATCRPGKVFEGRPSLTSNPPPAPGQGKGGTNMFAKKRRRAVTEATLLRGACLRESAQSAGSRTVANGGGLPRAWPHRRVYAVAEGNGAGSAHCHRRNNYQARGNNARSPSSRSRYYGVAFVSRWLNNPWALDRGNLCRIIVQARNRCRGIL